MVFVADFTAVAKIVSIDQILRRTRSLSFVLECNQTQILPIIGDPSDPIHIKTPTSPQEVVISGILYGNYLGIKEMFEEIIDGVDGVKDTIISVRDSSALTKYTRISGLVTAIIVFIAIVVIQVDINYEAFSNGKFDVLLPIFVGAGIASVSSFILEMLILTKERIRQ